ncbi:Pkinase-domain-containing protein [Laetiporus sulphureus 93-53]|uniref:Pkinase-domain-containing protein n=1 Tax=Laetiporus sulphureus 93-53 TaxID=1314785 RepID=A0A165BB03_9APHY|nr:Pkinase-domain-containing protein [Laetiporus sulphureus 93-53]KZT00647.1 Pkinase-domain-containing protein [Laetiporus sulphureus 93-53]
MPLPAKTDVLPKETPAKEQSISGPKLAVAQKLKRKVVVRTREEEAKVYGRTFVGCGRQEDYNVLTKLGEGTFGEVHKAVHRTKGNAVALKRILMHNEKEGMPVTALREIKILKALHHPCIVDILDMFVVKSQDKHTPLSVYMVFPYMDHDLAGLLENERVKLSPSQIKLYMKQLLEGTAYMHRNHILHRDMKAANLLISNEGTLKIADFGLARAFDPSIVQHKEDFRGKERKYTNCVVTRWYRPPELLLGARQYGGEVDMWGIGCVLGEMFWRKPILPGASDLDQLDKIWRLCGTPTQYTWPGYDALPGCEGVKKFAPYPRQLRNLYEAIGPETVDLLDKLLTCNPRERITAEQALDHDYFWTDPLPADPKTLPRYEASHEFDKRGRRQQAPVGPVLGQHMNEMPRQLPPPAHMQRHRAPPPREAFRSGPPPHFYGGAHNQGPPQPAYPSYPPAQGYAHPPQRYPPGPGPMPPASTLMPITLRPGQPPPQIAPWQPPPPRPVHLPPRPQAPMPMGRGTGPHRDHNQPHYDGQGGYNEGALNYG